MPRVKDQAICIRLLDWSETSQIVALFTAEHGLLRGLAKGAKRFSPSSLQRFSGGIELLTAGEIVANLKTGHELAQLIEWDLQQPWWKLRESLAAQRLALYAADALHALVAEHDPHPGVFAVLHTLLGTLAEGAKSSAASRDQQLALLRFQWALLNECGYRPQVEVDVITGEELPTAAKYQFDARAGGFTVAHDRADHPERWAVRGQTLELLRWLDDPQQVIEQDAAALTRANRLLCVYLRSVLGRELPTMNLVLEGG